MENNERLLPCPFCGKKPKLTAVPDQVMYSVRCEGCTVQWPKYTKEEAIAAWNKRSK